VAGYYDDFHLRPAPFHLDERVYAAHPREPHIEDGEGGTLRVHRFEADHGVLRDEDLVAFVLEDVPHRGPDAGFVVDHENDRHRAHAPTL